MHLLSFVLAASIASAPAAANHKVLPPAGLASYLTQADYPASAVRNREQGSTTFGVVVDTKGRVSGCTIIVTSGSSALDATTCRLMRARLRFQPAQDANGRAVEDRYEGTVHWRLP